MNINYIYFKVNSLYLKNPKIKKNETWSVNTNNFTEYLQNLNIDSFLQEYGKRSNNNIHTTDSNYSEKRKKNKKHKFLEI